MSGIQFFPQTLPANSVVGRLSLNPGPSESIPLDVLGTALQAQPTGASLVGFLAAGAGAQPRTSEAKLRDIVSIQDFGAIGDGASHPLSSKYATLAAAQVDYPFATGLTQQLDWAARQLAINTVGALLTGGAVFNPPGRYRGENTLTVTFNNVEILGAGWWCTQWQRLTDYGDTLVVTGPGPGVLTGFSLSNIEFLTSGSMTTGAHVRLVGVNRFSLDHVHCQDGNRHFQFEAATQGHISEINAHGSNMFGGTATGRYFMYFLANNTYTAHPSCGGITVTDFEYGGIVGTPVLQYGIRIDSSDGLWFENGHVGATTVADLLLNAVDATANNFINLLWFTAVNFDACSGAGVLFQGNAQVARHIHFISCIMTGGQLGTNAVATDGVASFVGVLFAACTMVAWTGHGVAMSSPNCIDWLYSVCSVRGNGVGSGTTKDGYNITAGDKIRILGGEAGGNAVDSSAIQRFGVAITGGTRISLGGGLDLRDNVTASYSIGSSHRPDVTWGDVETDESDTIASASNIDLPARTDVIRITGGVIINSISQTFRGRKPVVLIFVDGTTLKKLNNIFLAADFVATANDAIMLAPSQGNFYQCAPASVN